MYGRDFLDVEGIVNRRWDEPKLYPYLYREAHNWIYVLYRRQPFIAMAKEGAGFIAHERSLGWMDNSQPQMFFVSVEVAVILQEFMVVFDTICGNETIYRLADGDSFLPQDAIVPGALNRKRWGNHAFLHKFP
jgi:hypothetical protein